MGEMAVPEAALWGASTQRAVLNFPVSGESVDPALVHAYGLIKWVAAGVNAELGIIPREVSEWIRLAAEEVHQGRHDEHFVVDVFQTGSGTSTNMNANEVIANRCSQLAGKAVGSKDPVHPNDHVNQGQSSNDTFPTAIHLAVAELLQGMLLPSLVATHEILTAKAEEFLSLIHISEPTRPY